MSDQLEPELERVARMLAEAGPLPDAPASLRERALAVPDGGPVADADLAAAARRRRRRFAAAADCCGIAAVVAAIAIVPAVSSCATKRQGPEHRARGARLRAAGRRHGAGRRDTVTAARRSSSRSGRCRSPAPARPTRPGSAARATAGSLGTFSTDATGNATVSFEGAARRVGRLPLDLGDERARRRQRDAERADRALGPADLTPGYGEGDR